MKNRTVIIISAALVAACVVVLSCAALIGGITFLQRQIASFPDPSSAIGTPHYTSTPVVLRPPIPTEESQFKEPDESSSSDSLHAPIIDTPSAIEYPIEPYTLDTLRDAKIPINDPIDIIKRFEGRIIPSMAVDQAPVPLSIGAREPFWVIDTDINRSFQVNAVLRQVSDHVYFWIEEGIDYNQDDLTRLVNTFENQIYPTNRAFFGSEWSPGVDGDPHLYILYTSGLGDSVAGLFSPGDEYPAQAIEYSNEHEMFLLNADTVGLDETFTYGVLAHEFQHMIHWNRDRNEQSWLNEGFAELAMLLNGYDTGGVARLYTYDTDIQLNDWPRTDQDSLPHYGASFLFVTYFLDRFGEEATQALVAEPENGLESIDSLLQNADIIEMHSNRVLSADDVFADWVVANYLQDKNVGDGRYSYSNLPSAPSPMETETISNCPSIGNTRDVHQYGVDYVRITCPGEHTLNFEGSVQVDLLPADPHSGEYAFWSNKGDESDMTLTR
ncbi:MAG: hypothetical protein U9R58_04840, partial [Chloroflexota bacterium]|nr:hypothetical protein [Chloroflexota bacterium]